MRLIDADSLMKRFKKDIVFHDDQHAQELINEAPTIQVTPQVYGDDYCSNAVERREDGEV